MLKLILYIFIFLVIGIAVFLFWPESKLPTGIEADRIVVNKSKRELELWAKGEVVKKYKISLGKNPIGHKEREGDSRTPEGLYYINDKNPNSGYHLNLGISYPNERDKQASTNPGGDIKIHGLKNGNGFISRFHRFADWTEGCIAVTNSEMDELFEAVPIGTPIQINP